MIVHLQSPASRAHLEMPSFARVLPPTPDMHSDWLAVSRFLRSVGLHMDTDFEPRRFATGHANLNYLVRCDDRWAVLRRPPHGPIPLGSHDMAREHRVLSRLHERFPLAPRSLALCDDASIIGVPFVITEYRDGIVISGAKPSHVVLDRHTCSRISDRLVDTLVELHTVDPATVGLDTLGRPEGFLERAVMGWARRAQRVWSERPPVELEEVLGWLAINTPKTIDVCLLHCDFKLDNLILDPISLAPVALVDWDMSTRGDPLFDVATMLSYWTEAGDPKPLHDLDQMPTSMPGFDSRERVLAAYAERTGRPVDTFRFHRVLCLLKLAVVFAQLHARWQPDDTTVIKFERFGRLARELLAYCNEVRRGDRA